MPAEPARRSALGLFIRVLGAGLAAVYALPAALYLRGRAAQKVTDEFIDVAALAALPDGKPVRVALPSHGTDAWSETAASGGAVYLLRRGSEVRALDSVCPHTGCSVSWDEARSGFRCPCHQSAFSIDGACLHGPAPRGLDAEAVRIVGDRVQLRYVRYRPGRPDRVPV